MFNHTLDDEAFQIMCFSTVVMVHDVEERSHGLVLSLGLVVVGLHEARPGRQLAPSDPSTRRCRHPLLLQWKNLYYPYWGEFFHVHKRLSVLHFEGWGFQC